MKKENHILNLVSYNYNILFRKDINGKSKEDVVSLEKSLHNNDVQNTFSFSNTSVTKVSSLSYLSVHIQEALSIFLKNLCVKGEPRWYVTVVVVIHCVLF